MDVSSCLGLVDAAWNGALKMPLGSLIQHYPNFNARLRDSLRELVGDEVEKKVDIGLAKDGSGVGGMFSLTPRAASVGSQSDFFCLCSCSLRAPGDEAGALNNPRTRANGV